MSRDDYPDPTDYGWEFTGSCEERRVEYFEKHFEEWFGATILLDFDYTTGIVKGVFEYLPTNDVRRRVGLVLGIDDGDDSSTMKLVLSPGTYVSPRTYRKVLEDPREHYAGAPEPRNDK